MESAVAYPTLLRQDKIELIDVSTEEYNESKKFIESEDAIMDDSVFLHIKKVISYLYRNKTPAIEGNSPSVSNMNNHKTEEEYAKELNRSVLNTLVDGYVGYAWLCEVCARWIREFNDTSEGNVDASHEGEMRNIIAGGTSNIIHEALMSFLTTQYDTDKMRIYMEDKDDHGKWNPPELYWNLMKSPLVVSHMLKIYREKPKDEFLSSWYQDYINNFSSYMKMEQNEINKESLSRITSNFSVFTLRISEEIRKFLLKDDLLDSINIDTSDPISPLFWHAENAYIYSQALLHFIYQWRIDLRGCRRLSQLIANITMYPNSDIPQKFSSSTDKGLREWSASQIHLLMTNFGRFPSLYASFKRLSASQTVNGLKLNSMDVCDFYDELNKTLMAFDNYGFLLFDRHAPEQETPKDEKLDETEDTFVDQSVSQYGDTTGSDEYMRLRNAPEMPPLEAIRESNLLNTLIGDFANEDINLPDSNTWIRYANLLVLLSVISPYEMLYFHYEERVFNSLKALPHREVWKQFYLQPNEDGDTSLDEIENARDNEYRNEIYDDYLHDNYRSLYSIQPASDDSHANIDEFDNSEILSGSESLQSELNQTYSRIHKAWNGRSKSPSFITESSERNMRKSTLSSSVFESDTCGRDEKIVSADEDLYITSDESGSNNKPNKVSADVQLSIVAPEKRSLERYMSNTSLDIPDNRPTKNSKWMITSPASKKLDEVSNVDEFINEEDYEYLEIRSTLASVIYKNKNEGSKLGPAKNISPERIAEMKELYAEFKIKSDKLKGVARKELYQLYKLIRNQSMEVSECEFEMRNLMSTNIAASVIIAYITHVIRKRRNISALCNIKLLLLKEIVDRHPVKRTPIAIVLRDICECCTTCNIEGSSITKLERLEAIVDLLVYIARFERQSIPVIAIFDSIIGMVDRNICRHFISTILKYCGPPYAIEFCIPLLKLVEKFINLGNIGLSNTPCEKDLILVDRFIKPFLEDCLQNNFGNKELVQIAKRCNGMLSGR